MWIYRFDRFVILVFLVCSFSVSGLTQSAPLEGVLTNENVIELVKAGLSEGVILAKIKDSTSKFDTSSAGLIALKNGGVSDNLILAMIEAGNRPSTRAPAASPADLTPATLADAVGKKVVFLDSEDERSELKLIEELKKAGYEVVTDRTKADLVFDFSVSTSSVDRRAGILGGYETSKTYKLGKLVVYLRSDSGEKMVFARERELIVIGFMAGAPPIHKQAADLLDKFLSELRKSTARK